MHVIYAQSFPRVSYGEVTRWRSQTEVAVGLQARYAHWGLSGQCIASCGRCGSCVRAAATTRGCGWWCASSCSALLWGCWPWPPPRTSTANSLRLRKGAVLCASARLLVRLYWTAPTCAALSLEASWRPGWPHPAPSCNHAWQAAGLYRLSSSQAGRRAFLPSDATADVGVVLGFALLRYAVTLPARWTHLRRTGGAPRPTLAVAGRRAGTGRPRRPCGSASASAWTCMRAGACAAWCSAAATRVPAPRGRCRLAEVATCLAAGRCPAAACDTQADLCSASLPLRSPHRGTASRSGRVLSRDAQHVVHSRNPG